MAKFAGLDGVRQELKPVPVAAQPPSKIGRARAGGKRSDVAFEQTSLLLNKVTKFEAQNLLHRNRLATGEREDLSQLVGRLLRAWVAESADG